MNKSDKIKKKLIPRLVSLVLAALCGIALFAFNRYVVFTPDANKNNDIKFVIPKKNGDTIDTDDLKYNENSYNFLVMGHDRAASLTDVIMLINYNIEEQKVTVMQIPRDTYVRIGDYYYHKINGLYNYCIAEAEDEGSEDSELDGCIKTAEFLEENLACKIHYCAVMDLDGFAGIVDAIGGVDMYVPMDMYYSDPGQNLLINLYEGQQHLDGDKAEQFVRYRYGYVDGDVGRGNAQKLFISAFVNKLKTSITDVSTISALAKEVTGCVKTNITDADIVYFGKCFLGLGKEKAVDMDEIKMFTMPGNATMYEGASLYCMYKEVVCNIIDENYNIYDFSIKESFDINNSFVTDISSPISDIYYTPEEDVDYTVYDAQDLKDNGLG